VALVHNSTLAALHLCGCGITAAGAAHLAEGVGKRASLATLILCRNKIWDSWALVGALTVTSALTNLNLGLRGITAAVV
jgi:hypothetical protein